MSDISLCHSCAGAAVKCDPGLIPMAMLAIEHICFVLTEPLSQGQLVSEPSRSVGHWLGLRRECCFPRAT